MPKRLFRDLQGKPQLSELIPYVKGIVIVGFALVFGLFPTRSSSQDQSGLKKKWEKEITSPLAGVPFKSVISPSVWGLAFAPDGKDLAMGVGFIEPEQKRANQTPQGRYSQYPYKSFVLIVSPNQPDVVKKRFEMPLPPWLNLPSMTWTEDRRFIVVNFHEYSYDEAILFEVETGMAHVIHKKMCDLVGVLNGPEIVLSCYEGRPLQYSVKILGLDESVLRKSDLPVASFVFAVDPIEKHLAVRIQGPFGSDSQHLTWAAQELTILNASDFSEVQRWNLPAAMGYSGLFVRSGELLCVGPAAEVFVARDLVCRSVLTGKEEARIPVHWVALMSEFAAGGNRLAFSEEQAHAVPRVLQRPLDTSFVMGGHGHVIWDLQRGQQLAFWKHETQKTNPHLEAGYSYALSTDGTILVIGGSGKIVGYDIRP